MSRLTERVKNWLLADVPITVQKSINRDENWAVSWQDPSFARMAQEGMRANAVVFACLGHLASGFAEPRLRMFTSYQDTDAVPATRSDGDLARLLSRPNRDMSQAELMKSCMLNMAIGGTAYIHKLRDRPGGEILELWPYNAGQIMPKFDGIRVTVYRMFMSDGTYREIPVEDVIKLPWMPDPIAPYVGLSPIRVLARQIDTDNEATRYIYTLLKNDAVPRLVLTLPDTVILTDPMFERQKKQWNERHGGVNQGGVGILEGGMKAETMSMSLDDMAMDTLRAVPEARICAAFMTPAELVGVSVGLEHSTYSNKAEARLAFTEGTLMHFWSSVADEIDQGLRYEFLYPDNDGLLFDTSQVMALEKRRTEKRESMLTAYDKGVATLNETRGVWGLPELPDGDEVRKPAPTIIAPAPGDEGTPEENPDEDEPSAVPPKPAPKPAPKKTGEPELNDQFIEEAIDRWDEVMPDYAGVLDAVQGRPDA